MGAPGGDRHVAQRGARGARPTAPCAGGPPQATPVLPRLFGERWPPDGEGGFSRAKGADTMLPVQPIPLLGTP